MAKIYPFQPYRYRESAGKLANLVAQPDDKIIPKMQEVYLSLSPHNLCRMDRSMRNRKGSPLSTLLELSPHGNPLKPAIFPV